MNNKNKNFRETIEDFLYSDSKKATAAKFVLMTLALGGIVFIGALAPAIFSATEGFRKSGKDYSRKKIQNTVSTLKYRKLIEIVDDRDGKIKVRLTNKGEKRVKEFLFEILEIKRPKKWDKKWRVLIFDIPTKPAIYNHARNALRDKIKELGFYQLQKSVWAYPYECEDEILLLAEIYQVQKFIEIMIVDKFLHGQRLKQKFRL
jgi:hypothetical protein